MFHSVRCLFANFPHFEVMKAVDCEGCIKRSSAGMENVLDRPLSRDQWSVVRSVLEAVPHVCTLAEND